MKHLLFTLVCLIGINLIGQNNFVSIEKAKMKHFNVLVENAEQYELLTKKVDRLPNLSALRIDIRWMNEDKIESFIGTLKSIKRLELLELEFNPEVFNVSDLKQVLQLKALRVMNRNSEFGDPGRYKELVNLESIGFYTCNKNTVPWQCIQSGSIGTIELIGDITNEMNVSEMALTYGKDSANLKKLVIVSYCEGIDLSNQAVKSEFQELIPNSKPFNRSHYNQYLARTGCMNPTYARRKVKTLANFNPLFPEKGPKIDIINIDNSIENSIITSDGCILKIPANAFIRKDGKVMGTEVEIVYRSIRTIDEIASVGINMQYDTAGETEWFKTNGMFEVRAYEENNELELNKDKSISISFPSNGDSSNYNFYNMSDKTGQWSSLSSLNNKESNNKNINIKSGSYTMKDKTPFANRYEDLSYNNVIPAAVGYGHMRWEFGKYKGEQSGVELYKYVNERENLLRRDKSLIKFKTTNDVKDKDHPRLFFQFSYVKTLLGIKLLDVYPELEPFLDYKFEVENYIKSTEFTKLYKKGKIYNDIRILYEPGDLVGIVELKSKDGFDRIEFKAYVSRNGSKKVNSKFRNLYKKYLTILNLKEKTFNEEIYKVSTNSKNSELYDVILNKNVNLGHYQMDIDVLGFFNCDQLFRLKRKVTLNDIKFTINGKTIENVNRVMVVDSAAGGTFTFSPSKVTMSKVTVSGIVIVLGDIVYTCKGWILRQLLMDGKIEAGIEIPVQEIKKVDSAEGVFKEL